MGRAIAVAALWCARAAKTNHDGFWQIRGRYRRRWRALRAMQKRQHVKQSHPRRLAQLPSQRRAWCLAGSTAPFLGLALAREIPKVGGGAATLGHGPTSQEARGLAPPCCPFMPRSYEPTRTLLWQHKPYATSTNNATNKETEARPGRGELTTVCVCARAAPRGRRQGVSRAVSTAVLCNKPFRENGQLRERGVERFGVRKKQDAKQQDGRIPTTWVTGSSGVFGEEL